MAPGRGLWVARERSGAWERWKAERECAVERQGAETGREALKKQAGGRMQGRDLAGPARPSPPRQPVSAGSVRGTQSQARPAALHPPRILALKPIPPIGGLTALLEARPAHGT